MKKIGLLIVMIVISAVFVGCEEQDKYDLYIFNSKREIKAELSKLVKEYGEENDLNVKLYTIGEDENLTQVLREEMTKDNKPTIFNINGPKDLEVWDGYLADLSDMELLRSTQSNYIEPVTELDVVYGLPVAIEGYGFVYNKTLFEKAGIDPEGITSYSDLENAVKLIDSQRDELGIDAVFSYPTKETWVTGLYTTNIPLAFEFYDRGVKALKKEHSIDFTYKDEFKKLLDLQARYTVEGRIARENNEAGIAPDLNNVTYTDQIQAFANGEVAIIQQGNIIYKDLKHYSEEAGNDIAEHVGIIPMFLDDDKFPNTIPITVTSYWAVSKKVSEAKQKTSMDFLNWLYTEKGDYVVQNMNIISPYSTVKTIPGDPLAEDILKYSNLQVEPLQWVYNEFPQNWGMDEVGSRIGSYIAGDISFNQLINESKSKWTELNSD